MTAPTVRQVPVGDGALDGTTDDTVRDIALGLWWLWLVTGVLWIVAGLVVLQFNSASVNTIGIIIGCMFLFAGVQQLVLAFAAPRLRWLWALFGLVFIACGVVALADPARTFAGLADVLGFIFLTVGVWWTLEAFLSRGDNSVWWLGLVSGVMMIVLAFWTSGQFFVHKAYVLLVFAGIWALMHGITDIAKAFMARRVRASL